MIKIFTEDIQNLIDKLNDNKMLETELISDGYHTFNELYFHRMILFSVICKIYRNKSWKSKLHADGTMFDNYFIVGITTPDGNYSYHYHMEYWEHFDRIKELKKAPEWDGHQSKDVTRLLSLLEYGYFADDSNDNLLE